MSFDSLRKSIKSCDNKCKLSAKNSEIFYFKSNNPDEVKILIVTEQPKEDKNGIIKDEYSAEDLTSKSVKIKMVSTLTDIFKMDFENMLLGKNSKYYWTHHTKCPSMIREYQEACMVKWFKKELDVFTNLKTIISFGTKAFQGITGLSENQRENSFYNYFWNEIEIIINKSLSKSNLRLVIDRREYYFLCLPHPSGVNPLSNLLDKFNPLINWFIEKS
jgi:uracil-DNA glycosylase